MNDEHLFWFSVREFLCSENETQKPWQEIFFGGLKHFFLLFLAVVQRGLNLENYKH